ncbi:MAG: HAMP domain-containing protein [candidate division WOR-3 bacterium]|nr:MAG: HAMP domain-containing protein [candidate division WOR-3 bacterium]
MQAKRKKYLINRKYQLSMIISVLAVVIMIVVTAILATHYFLLAAIVRAFEAKGSMLTGGEIVDISVRPLAIVIPIVIIVLAGAFTLIIFISHRTAGPLHSLKRAMEQVGEGDLSVRVAFRKNDEIHDIAESFNTMVEKLEGRSKKDKR